ncbi:hypothetical protein RRG08_049421 [Elysia crispata]|uniref:Uncharacterized protein n=1 Tax=Elysia crispata TaxID=231223 RepID=A0AAE0ZRX9_9GAST|nr:hypothetical protein RRG08_049421 [Elysia crispata]
MHPTVRHERALQIYDVTFACWMVYRFREGSLDFRDSGRSSSVQTRVLVLVMRKWLILAARPAEIASVSANCKRKGDNSVRNFLWNYTHRQKRVFLNRRISSTISL